MITTRQDFTADRDFAHSVGMELNCQMCDLLTIEAHRSAESIRLLQRRIDARERLIRRQRKYISTLKLSCFSATLMMLLFAWASLVR